MWHRGDRLHSWMLSKFSMKVMAYQQVQSPPGTNSLEQVSATRQKDSVIPTTEPKGLSSVGEAKKSLLTKTKRSLLMSYLKLLRKQPKLPIMGTKGLQP